MGQIDSCSPVRGSQFGSLIPPARASRAAQTLALALKFFCALLVEALWATFSFYCDCLNWLIPLENLVDCSNLFIVLKAFRRAVFRWLISLIFYLHGLAGRSVSLSDIVLKAWSIDLASGHLCCAIWSFAACWLLRLRRQSLCLDPLDAWIESKDLLLCFRLRGILHVSIILLVWDSWMSWSVVMRLFLLLLQNRTNS